MGGEQMGILWSVQMVVITIGLFKSMFIPWYLRMVFTMQRIMVLITARFFFSKGRFYWRNNEGSRFVMLVRHFMGYPVVYSNGYDWVTENGRDYFVVGYSNGHYYRMQHKHLRMRLYLAHSKVYPVAVVNDNYYGTNNGKHFRKIVFSDGHFWWRNSVGDRVVMPVREFRGYPVVYLNGNYWGSENGRDYFAVDSTNGHYQRIRHMNLLVRLHLSHYYETNNDHV